MIKMIYSWRINYPETNLASYREYYGIDFENKKNNLTASVGYIDITDYRIFVHTFQQEHSKGTVFVMHGYYDMWVSMIILLNTFLIKISPS